MNAKQLIAVSAIAFLGTNAAFAQEATSDSWQKVASTKSRAEVQAEVAKARAEGVILSAGEATIFVDAPVAKSTKSRDEVRTEARSNAHRFQVDVYNIGA